MKYPRFDPDLSGRISTLISLIGFFGLGFLMMGLLGFYLPYENQSIKSSAKILSPIQEAKCINAGGECQTGKLNEINKPCNLMNGTPGKIVFNYCPTQEGDVRCCIPNSSSNPEIEALQYSANLKIKLQGIGPNANIQSKTRIATIKIFNHAGSFDKANYAPSDVLVYDKENGYFENDNFNLGKIAAGDYQMVIQMQTYLDEQLQTNTKNKVFSLSNGASVSISPVSLRGGDLAPQAHGDNAVNIIDYNALLGCMPEAPPGACFNRDIADLNDDGVVDQEDMDILLENFNRKGFAFKTDQFKCEQDPACESGKDSLQLCSLLCTIVSKRS